MVFFSFKFNANSFIRRIYYNACVLIFQNIFLRKLIDWEWKGNFNKLQGQIQTTCILPTYIHTLLKSTHSTERHFCIFALIQHSIFFQINYVGGSHGYIFFLNILYFTVHPRTSIQFVNTNHPKLSTSQ